MELVIPHALYLPAYVDALERNWSSNTMRPEAAFEELELINADAEAFIAMKSGERPDTSLVTLPHGQKVERLPSVVRWLWDGEFAGLINLRYQPGTTDLPIHVLGHIGYSVVPWKEGRGYATSALKQLLPEAVRAGLPFVELTTDVTNVASQKVIERNGGVFVERFIADLYGPPEKFRWRISLA